MKIKSGILVKVRNKDIVNGALEFPDGVTDIGEYAFSGCSNLIKIKVPDGIRSIGDFAFCDCPSLKTVTIPDSVKSIGECAFSNCSGIQRIILPDSMTNIGSNAFSGCSNLTSITIPNNITSISDFAFCDCPGLESVIIPSSVTSIGEYAFASCYSLSTIIFNGTQEQWETIQKGCNWDYMAGPYRVNCVDGAKIFQQKRKEEKRMKTAKEYRLEAKSALKGNWGAAILTSIIYSLILGAAAYSLVGGILLTGALMVGLSAAWISLYRSGQINIGDLFSGFRVNFANTLVMGILYNLFVFLWSLLFVIPGIVASYSYAMAPYILADNPTMGGLEAISASKALMKGKKWKLFCIQFSFIGWMLLGILTFGILFIWITPWMQATTGAFYESIKDEAPPAVDTAA